MTAPPFVATPKQVELMKTLTEAERRAVAFTLACVYAPPDEHQGTMAARVGLSRTRVNQLVRRGSRILYERDGWGE